MPDLIITGFERALIGFLDSTGGFIGQSTTLANGSTGAAYVCTLVRTGSFQAMAPTNLDIPGGDIVYTTVQFGNAKTAPFDLILSDYDTALVTMLSGSSTNTTNSQVTIVSDNPNRRAPRVLALGLQSRVVDVNGVAYYLTRWFPSCQMRIKRNGPAWQAQSDTVISCTPQAVTKDITARSFGSAGLNLGLTDDRADNYDYISYNPVHVMAFRQDNSATTFTSIYRPNSSTVTLNATPNNFFIATTATALSSVNTTTGVNTLAAAGTAAVLDVLQQETQYVPV